MTKNNQRTDKSKIVKISAPINDNDIVTAPSNDNDVVTNTDDNAPPEETCSPSPHIDWQQDPESYKAHFQLPSNCILIPASKTPYLFCQGAKIVKRSAIEKQVNLDQVIHPMWITVNNDPGFMEGLVALEKSLQLLDKYKLIYLL